MINWQINGGMIAPVAIEMIPELELPMLACSNNHGPQCQGPLSYR